MPAGGSVTAPTKRLASGMTTRNVGNATTHDQPHDVTQVGTKPGVSPTTRTVEMPETMPVMSSVSTNGSNQAAERAGSRGILLGPPGRCGGYLLLTWEPAAPG